MRFAWAVIVIGSIALSQLNAGEEASAPTKQRVQLTLSTDKAEMVLNHAPIILRVQLENHGLDDFFVSRELLPITNAPGYLQIECVSAARRGPLLEDAIIQYREDISSEWWGRIAPGHFYGTEVQLDPKQYERLNEPGTYQLTATYVSHGGTTPRNLEWNLPAHTVWAGELKSNSITIRILPVRN